MIWLWLTPWFVCVAFLIYMFVRWEHAISKAHVEGWKQGQQTNSVSKVA